ncbi:unnamed protein product [Ilex paraguariensis]|uniref:Kinesin motor domain-containing protein n=1 Tax=Ilex paraguariensis TaxID=185542 RepID=A0ABC8T3Q3_9AQUA
MKSRTEISDNRFLGRISATSIKNLLPRSVSSKQKTNTVHTKSRCSSENTPPVDPNIVADNNTVLPSIPKQSQLKLTNSPKEIISSDDNHELPAHPDPPVKVMARIRPVNDHESGHLTVSKVSDDSISVGDRNFTFDSVLDSNSSQEDVFRLVGVPLVKDALAGYNTSILAYGQTGSGKTYTMWGPPSSMVDGHSASSLQGIVPRIFHMLFSEFQREQENAEGKQINFQCRCSFLEIYNEQIGDLLDPTQRNLEIKDDAKNGFYLENLTEEYVTSYEDVTQILIKGLSSRKVGATSINSKSSRSHLVFTCMIESWCKETSSKCFGSSKTSRISLVDLAGLDRNRLDDAGRMCVKEAQYVKKSISQLGFLVNNLTKRTQPGKPEAAVPYSSSCLTHLLRESLGGNAKLTVICAISPDKKCHSETMSTLRFGQLTKFMSNEPVINEIREDDVDDLSDKIRQLKEELIRAKLNACNSSRNNSGYFMGRSIRESVNQLRLSLNRSLILPRIDNDSEEDVHIDEHDVRELCQQFDNLHRSCEENSKHTFEIRDSTQFASVECCKTGLTSEHYVSFSEDSDNEEISSKESETNIPHQDCIESVTDLENFHHPARTTDPAFRSRISISACRQSAVLQDPTLSESPKIENAERKSIVISSNHVENQENVLESSKFNPLVLRHSLKESDHIRSSLRSSKIFPGPAESLAASLQRGLQIIDYHQQNSTPNKPSVAFSFEHLTLKPSPITDKANASVQTLPDERLSLDGPYASFLCASCQKRGLGASNRVQDSSKIWTVAVDAADQVPEDAVKDLAESIKREKELENVCKEQTAKIEQLNHLVELYKHEREQNAIIEYSNAHRVEGLKNEVQAIDNLKTENNYPVKDENKLLRWNDSENLEPEIIKKECEIKEIREELEQEHRRTSFNMNEKEEIEGPQSKLQSYTDASPHRSTDRLRSSLLSQSIQLRKSYAHPRGNGDDELEKERQTWMEMESDWISLTEELRIDLESNRQRAEKVEMELRFEKKCTEELDDVLKRSVLGHARMVEHYAELQEKYNDLVEKHRSIMEGIAEVKRAAAKAGAKGHGSRFSKSLAAELSALRVERERERELLKKENRSLRIQLRDTAEAVHAAGELLVRLREAEQSASVAEENFTRVQEDNEHLKKQIEKLKRKHKMEMITMKQYLAESRLPEAALRPLYREDSDVAHNDSTPQPDDDQAWRAEFGAIYQEHY